MEAWLAPLVADFSHFWQNFIENWWNHIAPLTWISHSLVWVGIQTVGHMLEGWWVALLGAGRVGMGAILGFLTGAGFYGYRETASLIEYVHMSNWLGVGDSVFDFLVPALLNAFLLIKTLEVCSLELPGKLGAGREGEQQPPSPRFQVNLRSKLRD